DGLRAAGAIAGVLATSSRDGTSLEFVQASPGWPAALSGDPKRVPMTTPAPLSICAWLASPLWIGSRAALATDYPHLAAPSRALPDVEAVACLPLSSGG